VTKEQSTDETEHIGMLSLSITWFLLNFYIFFLVLCIFSLENDPRVLSLTHVGGCA
jgi:hypothetical protein